MPSPCTVASPPKAWCPVFEVLFGRLTRPRPLTTSVLDRIQNCSRTLVSECCGKRVKRGPRHDRPLDARLHAACIHRPSSTGLVGTLHVGWPYIPPGHPAPAERGVRQGVCTLFLSAFRFHVQLSIQLEVLTLFRERGDEKKKKKKSVSDSRPREFRACI